MNIENIKEIMDNLDLAALFPEIHSILDLIAPTARFLMLLGPMVLLALGLYYFLASPKEANYRSGYRCHWGMGSVQAWQFTQKLAGAAYALTGLSLAIAMAILGRSLAELELMDQLLRMVQYIALQALVLIPVRLLINLVVLLRFDAKGNRRYSWIELLKG